MVFAILRALSVAVRRDLASLESVKVNNFFLFVALLIYGALVSGVKPASAEPFLLLLGFLLLFPLSSDPLDRIPPQRLALWPIAPAQRFGLRLASAALSPVLWLTIGIMLVASPALALFFLGLAVTIQAVIAMGARQLRRAPTWSPRRYVPSIPGRLGGMIRNNVREMLSLLDPYLAGLLCIAGGAYRWLTPHPDAGAFPILAMLVALALSTYAQCLFGLDSAAGIMRYRLLPLCGWQILLAKDVALLGALAVLVLPLHFAAGMSFGLTAVAIGHFPSLSSRRAQRRWRFTSGKLVYGVAQMLLGATVGFAAREHGAALVVATTVLWILSLLWCGRQFDRRKDAG